MTTRAGAAANSRQIQQRLVRLLFDHEFAGKGREQHRKLDFASYTYSDLRTAYLKRIQTTHPDKFFNRTQKELWAISRKDRDGIGFKSISNEAWDKRDATSYFIELQDAWKAYDQYYKHMRQGVGEKGTGDFTMFGVGCSFSDNAEERELRNEIMDQACKGWFSAGSLSENSDPSTANSYGTKSQSTSKTKREWEGRTLISDNDLFVTVSGHEEVKATPTIIRKRSLVDHLRPNRNE